MNTDFDCMLEHPDQKSEFPMTIDHLIELISNLIKVFNQFAMMLFSPRKVMYRGEAVHATVMASLDRHREPLNCFNAQQKPGWKGKYKYAQYENNMQKNKQICKTICRI
jgi:hypothetical protein